MCWIIGPAAGLLAIAAACCRPSLTPGKGVHMGITTRAAVCRVPGQPWEITELELDDPRANEVRIKFYAAGLCHSDDHIQKGDAPMRMPVVGGHEGAGIVDAVGPSVTRVKVGDHVTCSFIPACGKCRYCSTGRQQLCDAGLNAAVGCFLDGTFRFHQGGEDFGGLCVLGTFSQYAVVHEYSVIKIPEEIPFDVAALVACGVPTGWGSAVRAGGVRAGQTVVIYGTGGVGMNAVQGASLAGAKNVIVVDPVAFKREMATTVFGATHAFATAKEAHEFVRETTWGQLADHAVHLHAGALIGYMRQIRGALAGDSNLLYDIPMLLGLYKSGQLKLDELVTRKYSLDEVNQAYKDLNDGKNIRGVIVHEH